MSSQAKILNAGDMSLTLHSQVVDLANLVLGSIQSIFTGAPTGSLYLEVSNQIIAQGGDPDALVTQWSQVSSSVVAVAAAGDFMHIISNMGYRWVRLSYVPAGGNGTLNSTMVGKDA